MLLEGTVIRGQIVLDPGTVPPEGARVKVEWQAPKDQAAPAKGPTLQWLLELAGTANDLPEDMARNHDHYLHGAWKR